MKNISWLTYTAALLIGLLSSCSSDEDPTEGVHQKDLSKIQSFIDNTDIMASRQMEVGNSGITLLFTKENQDGKIAEAGDSLKVNYTGYLLDGKVFDTSIEQVARDNNLYAASRPYEPYPVRLGYRGVIEGWHHALANMKEGEEATVLIPSTFAYGSYGQGAIGPNAVLAFDLELVEVIKP